MKKARFDDSNGSTIGEVQIEGDKLPEVIVSYSPESLARGFGLAIDFYRERLSGGRDDEGSARSGALADTTRGFSFRDFKVRVFRRVGEEPGFPFVQGARAIYREVSAVLAVQE